MKAQTVIDSALIHSALKEYRKGVTPIADYKTLKDLDRLINEYGTISRTVLTYGPAGELEVSQSQDRKGTEIFKLNNVKR